MGIAQDPELPGYEEFEKQAWGFKVCSYHRTRGFSVANKLTKHDRLNVERRIANSSPGDGPGTGPLGDIKTSDVARLLELFQVRR